MKGSYVLVIFVPEKTKIDIGALGNTIFDKGYYLYIGSAMGSNGSNTLENRVKRHVSTSNNKKTYWHIDYLLNYERSIITKVFLIPSLYRLECLIARELMDFSDGFIEDFGSTDCLCNSHLYYFQQFKGSGFLIN
jgi:Uri superfamily endonuclease